MMLEGAWTLLAGAPIAVSLVLYIYKSRTKAVFKKVTVTSTAWQQSLSKVNLLWPYVVTQTKEERRYALLLLGAILVCIAVGRGINILNPLLLREMMAGIGQEKTAVFPWSTITGYVVLRYFIIDLVSFLQWTLMRRLENQVLDRISIAVYDKLMSLSADYQDEKDPSTAWSTVMSSGKTVSRFASNVCFTILPNVLDLLFAVMSFTTIGSPQLAIAMVLVLVCYGFALVKTSKRSDKDIEEWDKVQTNRSKQASQTILNWWTVSLFNQIPREVRNHKDVVAAWRAVDTKWCDGYWFNHNAKNFVKTTGLLIIYLMLSHDIWQGRRGAGDLMMLMQQWHELLRPVQDMLGWNERIITFGKEVEKLIDIMSKEPSVQDKQNADEYSYQGGSIAFKDVSFKYKDVEKCALEDISFNIPAGSLVAIVGQSGGGKSTILKLIKRCYDATSGTITVDGQDVKDVTIASLSSAVALAPQNIGVFRTTLLENVRYARPDATDEECKAICKAVNLQDLIDKDIGERGDSLSGGQLQRVAIARAIIQNASILLLDEATSHLDSDTEASVINYLREWRQQRTIIMVAHSFASIWDREHAHIVAMKDGRIVEQGREADLLAKKGYYYDLWSKQHLS